MRIVWALQGRLEHGRLALSNGSYLTEFLDEYRNFPSPQVHDDMLDALAYIDQVSSVVFADDYEQDDFTPLDETTGY